MAAAPGFTTSQWLTHTVIAGLRLNGLTETAVREGPVDNPLFFAYGQHASSSTRRHDGVVVLNNIAVNEQPATQTALDAVGATRASSAPFGPAATTTCSDSSPTP